MKQLFLPRSGYARRVSSVMRSRHRLHIPRLENLEPRVAPSITPQDIVSQVYRDLLHREAEPTGLESWVNVLQGGASRIEVVSLIETNREYRLDQVEDLYSRFLHRSADTSGLNSDVSFLSGGGTVEALSASILASPEYLTQRGGNTNVGYLASLYQDVLGRQIDPAGSAFWGQVLASSNDSMSQQKLRSQIATAVVSSPEARDVLVNGWYQSYLHRNAEPTGLAFWVGKLNGNSSDESVIAGIVGSDEYAARITSQTPLPPASPVFDLSADSRVGSAADHTTNDARVTLIGQTDPNVTVVLVSTAATTASSNKGVFQFQDVALAPGNNTLTVRATNATGQSTDFTLTIQRTSESSQPNEVIVWNQVLLNAILTDDSTPPVASRAMAMVQMAVFDAVNAVDGTPTRFVSVAAPSGSSPEAAVASAAHRVLSYLYPVQTASFDASLTDSLGKIPNGSAKTNGVSVGQAVGDAVIALRANDGFDKYVNYTPGTAPGDWQPTAPNYDQALLPQWATLEPFVMTSDSQFRPAGPPALDSQAWADSVNETQSLGAADSTARTADQTQIARFWNDGQGSYTPPGHWNAIAQEVAEQQGDSLAEDARLFAELDVAMGDAAIVAWDAKYTYNTWRPITVIQNADSASNPNVTQVPNWQPFLITPNFPEYVSGHSTFSAAAAAVLDSFFGTNVSFTATENTLPGVTRSYTSFDQAAAEAGMSRIYGGIHFPFSNQDGQTAGHALGQDVLGYFNITADTQPPTVTITAPVHTAGLSTVVTAKNLTVRGRALDNLSGVAKLEVQLDSGSFAPVTLDAQGDFSVPTTLALDGSTDGAHVLNFQATDAAGNVGPLVPISFTLDSVAPQITLSSPTNGGSLDGGALLVGTADGTGSAITRLAYQLDDGVAAPIAFDSISGAFSQALDLSRAAAGQHTLTVSATDAAGNQSTTTITADLAAPIPFMVDSATPGDGSTDVGVTFRPQVFFSRPVDAITLTASDFYATDPSGATIAAKIVPATDGSFAWLFFANPMPGGATITLHVDGSKIHALGDGALLDAGMTGKSGSVLTTTFTTVNLTPLSGTSLSGKLVDPGPDLQPGTFDDVRAGPDQRLHTADDVYLLPIAGVKVFILGMEDQAVTTDADGNFSFPTVPAGDVKLSIEGTTTTNPPPGYYFPDMVMDLNLKAGQANTVMGTMGTDDEQAANSTFSAVYLPRLQKTILHNVTGTTPVQIGLDADAAQSLTPEQQSQLQLTVQPGSAVDANGNPMSSFQLGVSTVPPALVRDMLPDGVMQHTFDITIQAPGVATFATPATISFPNIFNEAPGTKMNFLSFDHTTGRLVIDGTATVSADGLSVVTDPGNGITHPGWHGLLPAGSPTGPGPAPNSPPCPPTQPTFAPPKMDAGEVGLDKDYLFTAVGQKGVISFANFTAKLDKNLGPCDGANALVAPLQIDIKFDAAVSGQFLVWVGPTHFSLLPQQTQDVGFFAAPLNLPQTQVNSDRLYGLRVDVTISQVTASGVDTSSQTIYVYRYLDALDDQPGDGLLRFPDIVNDGTKSIVRNRLVDYYGDKQALPTIAINGSAQTFGQSTVNPENALGETILSVGVGSTGADKKAPVQIISPAQPSRVAFATTPLQVIVTGTDPITVHLDLSSLEGVLTGIINSGAFLDPKMPLTANERTRFSLQAIANLTQTVMTQVVSLFKDVGNGINFVPDAGTGTGIQINWLASPIAGLLGEGDGTKVAFDNAVIALLKQRSAMSQALFDIRFAKLFSDYTEQPHSVFIYLNQILMDKISLGFDPTPDNVAVEITQVLAHELGHMLGLTHPAKETPGQVTNDVQSITVTGAGGYNFILAGDISPVNLTQNSTSTDVLKALLAIPTIAASGETGSTLFVEKQTNGFLINFGIPPSQGVFAGMDIPQLQVAATPGLNVTVKTLLHGNTAFVVNREVSINGELGGSDLMVSGYSLTDPAAGFRSFQPDISVAGLKLALRLGWTDADVQNYENVLLQSAALAGNNLQVAGALPDQATLPADPDLTPVPGAGTIFVNEDGTAAATTLDFGSVSAGGTGGGSVTKHMQLLDFGSRDIQIQSIRVVGNGGFSVSGISPGTIVPAGGTTNFDVTFAPLVGGDFTASLVVNSNADNNGASIALHGVGQAITPAIQLLPWSNDVGGVQVGQSETEGTVTGAQQPTIVNTGAQPLTITDIRVAAGHGQSEYGVDPNKQFPIVVNPGASFSFGFTFQPNAVGLREGAFEIVSNDPQTPILRIPVTGTGTAPNEVPNLANDYVAIQVVGGPSNGLVLRQRSDMMGNWNFFLAPDTPVVATVFDPSTGLVAHTGAVTNDSGQFTSVLLGDFLPSTAPDTDGDGLPDDVELAVGTNPNKVDTNGDGISDFDELALGLDPLAGRPSVTGVVGGLNLTGSSNALAIAPQQRSNKTFAYVATSNGLSIADVTRYDLPTLIGQINLQGNPVDVDVDAARQIAAVAAGSGGLDLINIADPPAPALLASIPVNATQVRIYDGLVYAAIGSEIHSYDLISGEQQQVLTLTVPGIQSFARDGVSLLALGTDGTVADVDLSGPTMVLRGSLTVPATATGGFGPTRLYAANGTAWIAGFNDLLTIDYSNPDQLRLIEDNSSVQLGGTAIALNGTGLGLVGDFLRVQNTGQNLRVIDASDPATAGNLVTAFALPPTPLQIVIYQGIAYVASSDGGLQVVNYLPFDTNPVPPTIQVDLPANIDIDPLTPGIQVVEGTTISLTAYVTDPVQIRSVQLLVNGQIVPNEDSNATDLTSMDLTTTLPTIAQAGNQATLEVIATDTGNHVQFSAPIVLDLMPDSTPPAITQVIPADGSTVTSLTKIIVSFSKPLAPATVTASDFALTGSAGPIAPRFMDLRQNDSFLTLLFPTIATAGDYQFVIHAASITDRIGNPLGSADVSSTIHVVPAAPPPQPPVLQAGHFTYVFEGPVTSQLRAVADFNGDGIPDIVVPIGGETSPNGFTSDFAVLLGKGDGSFDPVTAVPTVNGTVNAVATGDFNHDGKMDIALATDQGIQILLGNGDGSFQPPINAMPGGPVLDAGGLAVGDFNGDGKLDLAAFGGTVISDTHEIADGPLIYVLTGNGDGTFNYLTDPGHLLSLPNTDVIAADLTGNGLPDLVVTDFANSNVYIVKNQGNGNFALNPTTGSPTTTIPIPAGAKLAVVADLNGDGIPDIAVTGKDQISILFGNGDFTFAPPVTYSTPGAYDIGAADFSHDGRLDLLVSDFGQVNQATEDFSNGALYLLHNQGNGAFAQPTAITGVGSPFHLAIGNFAGDGGPDILFDSLFQGVTVLPNMGNGTFIAAQRSAPLLDDPGDSRVSRPLDMIATSDINGDGNQDLIIPDRDGYLHVLVNKGDGTFTELPVNPPIQQLPEPDGIAIGDLNADGKPDLVISNRSGYSVNDEFFPDVELLLGNGDGTFQPRTMITYQGIPIPSYGGIALADLSGKGQLSLITVPDTTDLQISTVNDDGTIQNPIKIPVPTAATYIQVADFNGDGLPDIATLGAVINSNPQHWQLTILLNLGGNKFSLPMTHVMPSFSGPLIVSDVNDDGIPDIIFAEERNEIAGDPNASNVNSIDVMLGNGDGTFQAPVQYAVTNHIGAYLNIVAADINGDGHPDILATTGNGASGVLAMGPSFGLAVLLNKGDGTFGAPAYYDHAGTTAGGLVVADFNNDKLPDVAVADLNDNTFSIIFAALPSGKPPQMQLASQVGARSTARSIEMPQLYALIDAAISDWAAAGASASQLASMRSLQWRITNLGGDALAEYADNTISLDDTADGNGWFVDPTPMQNEEFISTAAANVLQAPAGSPAFCQMDALTVVMHELGHVIGLNDIDPLSEPNSLMSETLSLGSRRLL
jgi:hypothetical protein